MKFVLFKLFSPLFVFSRNPLKCLERKQSKISSKNSVLSWQVGKLLMIFICNFHVLSHLLLIYIRKLHWNLLVRFVLPIPVTT